MPRERKRAARAIAAIADQVKDLISTELDLDIEAVTPDSNFVEDLGADSLDVVELTMRLEEEYGLEISETLRTVQDAITYVERAVARADGSEDDEGLPAGTDED